MMLQEATPDTLGYMLFGYGVILGTMALFALSLVSRFRNLRRDLELMEEVQAPKRTTTES
ncbi:MAG TPA: hypothetical protein VI520_08260 [Anaerolineales bacterium]|nr:hypothetical protein [Anaerolineales bacterium]